MNHFQVLPITSGMLLGGTILRVPQQPMSMIRGHSLTTCSVHPEPGIGTNGDF